MPRKHKITLRTGATTPSAADFAIGEPAWDSAGGTLYIKNGAGSMIPINSSAVSNTDPTIMGMIF